MQAMAISFHMVLFNIKVTNVLTGESLSSVQSVQSLSHVQLFVTPWTAACQASLSITNSQSLLKTHVHQVGDAIQPSHPLLSASPHTFNLSQHQGLLKSVSSSMDCLDLLAVQGTLKSLLQHHSSKASSIVDLKCCVNFC